MTTIATSIYRRLFHITMLLLVLFGSVTLSSAAPVREQTPGDALSALKASLTTEQQAAIKAVFQKYEPELAAIAKDMPSTTDTAAANPNAKPMVFLPFVAGGSSEQASVAGTTPALDTTSLGSIPAAETARTQQLQAANERANAVRAKMEQEFAAIFIPEQMANYRTGLTINPASSEHAQNTLNTQLSISAVSLVNTRVCGLAATNMAYARFSAQRGRAFAYIAAFDSAYPPNTTTAVDAYNALNASQYYALLAKQNIASAYIDLSVYGIDYDNVGLYGRNDALMTQNTAREAYKA